MEWEVNNMKEYTDINIISSLQREEACMGTHELMNSVSLNKDDFKNHKWRVHHHPEVFEKIPIYWFRVKGTFLLLPGKKLYSLTVCRFYRGEEVIAHDYVAEAEQVKKLARLEAALEVNDVRKLELADEIKGLRVEISGIGE